ncbi:hypothetical protein AVEN_271837-1 [Araneus ventricosus]|uniref:Uncharacterized protein n=1 Tax=Araneus ventricosus TaxID=182803 RepID=A0A4Y2NAK3_ARAVE|nr:hypothetical protein AVEN_271837-1 [Araneus ventricosus]
MWPLVYSTGTKSNGYRFQESKEKKIFRTTWNLTSQRGQKCKYDALVLHCGDKAPAVCQFTDAEIYSIELMNSKTGIDSEKLSRKIKCQSTAIGTVEPPQ